MVPHTEADKCMVEQEALILEEVLVSWNCWTKYGITTKLGTSTAGPHKIAKPISLSRLVHYCSSE